MSERACIPSTKCAPEHLGSVLVLGLGKSGKSVARYCASLLGTRVDRMFIAAGTRNADSEAFVESLAGEGVSFAFGDDALAGLVADASEAGGAADAGETAAADAGAAAAADARTAAPDAAAADARTATRPFDLCIASPGIPYWHELYQDGLAVSVELISEVEFAWRESAADSVWAAITGTNGKTTTTSLAAHVLRSCGFAANAVGNIGDVCLDAVAMGETQVYVAELSSYQLYSTRLFAPDAAVMLNITPDHIHWHKTLEAYRDAKFHLLDNMSAASTGQLAGLPSQSGEQKPQQAPKRSPLGRRVVILDAVNDVVRAKVRELKATPADERGFDYIPMGTADGFGGDMRLRCGARNAAFIDEEGVLHVAFEGVEHVLGRTDDLQIKGLHNASNALAASALAVTLGADDAQVAAALASFSPLEHRIEPCGSIAGVDCYNDSKATNGDATIKALGAFPGKRLVVMLGGQDKGTDLAELVAEAQAHAQAVVCFGEAGPRFHEAFEVASGQPGEGAAMADAVMAGGEPHVSADSAHAESAEGLVLADAAHLEDALDTALALAREHACEVVLLSPACASFDEFKSFEQRGDVFKRLVKDRIAAASSPGAGHPAEREA